VRVELPDGTAITSNSEPVAGQSDDDAERLWLERIAKHATGARRTSTAKAIILAKTG
jgi:hypothetical protein